MQKTTIKSMESTINNIAPLRVMVLVGNGFDRAMTYPTSYSDFYKSEFIQKLVRAGNNICNSIDSPTEKSLWSDLENGLFEYSKKITQEKGMGNEDAAKSFENDFLGLKRALFDYINNIQEGSLINDGRPRVVELKTLWEALSPQIVTFNYSRFLPVELNNDTIHSTFSYNQTRFIPIHGTVDCPHLYKKNYYENIVLGIDDSQGVEPLHQFLYKSHQRQFKADWIFQQIIDKRSYIIFGCSMGTSDAVYFRMLFNKQQKGKRFLIYGHNNDNIQSLKTNMCNYIEDWNGFYNNNEICFLDFSNAECIKKTEDFVNKCLSSK